MRLDKNLDTNRLQSPLEITNTKYSLKSYSNQGSLIETSTSQKPRGNLILPSLGPLQITIAPNSIPPAEKGSVSHTPEENSHSFIQHAWAMFSTMSDIQRNQLLKGLLSRSSSQQIEYICTCLNIKSLDDHSFSKTAVMNIFIISVLKYFLQKSWENT
jgi:hypothetical protein